MKNLSVLIKPASGRCNLKCKYCFYHDETSLRAVPDRGVMSAEVREAVITRALEEAESAVTFAFQGGEPMLAGLDFFRKFTESVTRKNKKNLQISYAIQTNGTLIDGDWCTFFKEYNFLVGVSIDGYAEAHDFLRKSKSGLGGYSSLMKAVALLKSCGVDFNVLTVVTKYIAAHPVKTYGALKSCGFKYLQFIPCLPPLNGGESFSPSASLYGKFLLAVYSLWADDYRNGEYVSIRLFDNIIFKLQGRGAELCSFTGRCSIQFVIEADGTVYPCDFYCMDGYELGSILTDGFSEMHRSGRAREFVNVDAASAGECAACRYAEICGGGCKRERINGANIFCGAYKSLFAEVLGENNESCG